MSIDEVSAERELDAQVAQMMGWWWDDESAYSPTGGRCSRKHGAPFWWLPCYSTDMETAWGVVRILTRRGYTLRLVGPEIPDTTGYLIEKGWSAAFVEPQYAFTDVGQSQGKGSTSSLAICRAALKVMAERQE